MLSTIRCFRPITVPVVTRSGWLCLLPRRSGMEQNRDNIFGTPTANVSDAQSTGTYRRTGAERTERSEGGVLDSARQMASGLMDQVKDQATTQAQDKKQTVASGPAAAPLPTRRVRRASGSVHGVSKSTPEFRPDDAPLGTVAARQGTSRVCRPTGQNRGVETGRRGVLPIVSGIPRRTAASPPPA